MPMVRLVDGTGGGGRRGPTRPAARPMCRAIQPGSAPSITLRGAGRGARPRSQGSAPRGWYIHYSLMVKGLSQMFVAGPPVVAPWAKRSPRRSSAAAKSMPATARSTRRSRARTRPSPARGASSPTCPPRSTAAAARPATTTQPARGVADRRDPARPPQGLSHPADRRGLRRPGSFFEIGKIGAPGRHRPRAPRRLAGRGDGERSVLLRRRLDARRGHKVGALRRPGRDLPPAGRAHGRQPRLPGRHRIEKAATIRHGARALAAVYQARRRGARSGAQVLRGRRRGAPAQAARSIRYAWPSGDWGSLPIAGGLEAAYKAELEARRPAALWPTSGPAQHGALAVPHRRASGRRDHRSARYAPAAVRVRQHRRTVAQARPAQLPAGRSHAHPLPDREPPARS